jgi:NADP-dependent 3-hydroxy acid dehydrogenase YdfG
VLLKDRCAVVYGAGGAVGGAVARALAREGARVFLAGRSRERLEQTASAIGAAGGWAEAASVDVLDESAVALHLAGISTRAGPLRIMFNAVGLDGIQGIPLVEIDRAAFIAPFSRQCSAGLQPGQRRRAIWPPRAAG